MKKWIAVGAVVLNFVGSILVFVSFVSTSADFFLTTLKNGNHAICVGNEALIEWFPNGGVANGAPNACVGEDKAPRIAVVVSDYPKLAKAGWFLLVCGFCVQLIQTIVDGPSLLTPEQLRILRKADKILEGRK
jgi:hypothetical protein